MTALIFLRSKIVIRLVPCHLNSISPRTRTGTCSPCRLKMCPRHLIWRVDDTLRAEEEEGVVKEGAEECTCEGAELCGGECEKEREEC